MQLKSLYHYFRVFFDYPTKGKVQYGRAVSDVMRVTEEMIRLKNISPFIEYDRREYSSAIAKVMLYKLLYYAKSYYENPFDDITYINKTIYISKNQLGNARKELKIPLRCGIDIKKGTLIMPVFSSSYDMKKELEVLKGLLKEFDILGGSLPEIHEVKYWNLSKMSTPEKLDFKEIVPVGREKLIAAANKALL